LRPAGAFYDEQNSPEISGDCEIAWYCRGKNHAFMAETFSVRGALSSGVPRCMCGNFTCLVAVYPYLTLFYSSTVFHLHYASKKTKTFAVKCNLYSSSSYTLILNIISAMNSLMKPLWQNQLMRS